VKTPEGSLLPLEPLPFVPNLDPEDGAVGVRLPP
jgi:hypothetical protein